MVLVFLSPASSSAEKEKTIMDSDCFFFLNIPFSSTAGFTLTLRSEGDLPPITFSATVRAMFM